MVLLLKRREWCSCSQHPCRCCQVLHKRVPVLRKEKRGLQGQQDRDAMLMQWVACPCGVGGHTRGGQFASEGGGHAHEV